MPRPGSTSPFPCEPPLHEQRPESRYRRACHRRCGPAGRRGPVLLLRRHRPLHRSAEAVRALRRQLHVRPGRDAVPGPADVVLGGQLRLCQRAPERRAQAPDRPPAAGRQPVPAPREDRAGQGHRGRRRAQVRPAGPRALQRRRRAGGRGLAEDHPQLHRRQEPDVRLRGRLPRPHPGRLGDHLQLPLPPPLRPLRRARDVPAVPVSVPPPQGHGQGGVRRAPGGRVRAPVRDRIPRRVGPEGRRVPSTRRSTSSRCRAPAATSSRR